MLTWRTGYIKDAVQCLSIVTAMDTICGSNLYILKLKVYLEREKLFP